MIVLPSPPRRSSRFIPLVTAAASSSCYFRCWWLFFAALLVLAPRMVVTGLKREGLKREPPIDNPYLPEDDDELPTPKNSKSDFLVEGLDEVEPAYGQFDGDMYAGTLPMNNMDKDGNQRSGSLMFWLFWPTSPVVRDTLVIWFNGGPGCSSFNAGVMMETAPVMIASRNAGYCCLSKNESLVYNPNAWTKATAMLYVEQPVGVGFSSGGPEPQSEDDVASDVYAFLVNFYKVFDDFMMIDRDKRRRLFVVGESYAGMYVPSIARKIYLENKKLHDNEKGQQASGRRTNMNLAGIALGNGWVDARIQGPATIDYAYWHGMIDSTTRDTIHGIWEDCYVNKAKTKNLPDPFHKFNIPDDCAMMEGVLAASGAGHWPSVMSGPNTYDVTTWDSYSVLLGGDNSIAEFFNDPRVKEKLHAPKDTYWQGCIPGAGRRRLQQQSRNLMLEDDLPVSAVPYIAELLDDAGVSVLVYNGDRDLSCCAQGSEQYLNSMEWSGASEWQTPAVERGLWTLNNNQTQIAGYAKEHKKLGFVVVYNSGHLVPFNVPVPALDLITRFLQNKSFKDYKIPPYPSPKSPSKPPAPSPGTKAEIAKSENKNKSQPPPSSSSRFWSGITLLIVACASFALGFYSNVYYMRSTRREGYEEISHHDGDPTFELEQPHHHNSEAIRTTQAQVAS